LIGRHWTSRGDKKKSFEDGLEELKAFKAKHGHVRVTLAHDKSLAAFCKSVRCARRGTQPKTVLTADRRNQGIGRAGLYLGGQEKVV